MDEVSKINNLKGTKVPLNEEIVRRFRYVWFLFCTKLLRSPIVNVSMLVERMNALYIDALLS
jgi:hypothetical protein